MKKFQFSLDKLKGYKEQILSKEKSDLAALRSQQRHLFDQRDIAQNDLDRANEDFRVKSARGMTIYQITVFKEYLKSLSETIREIDRKIAFMEEKIKYQTKVVVEANKDVSSLDKLEGKQREEYNFAVAKAEEKFIEEYVMTSSYCKMAN